MLIVARSIAGFSGGTEAVAGICVFHVCLFILFIFFF
jgi:hypothetical protein